MDLSNGVVGVLLAGGRSSRMGGGDKCLRQLGGKPILARVIDRLGPQVADIVINANGDASRFAVFHLPVVADSISGFSGPLAGVLAGIEWVAANRSGSNYVVTVATDTPFFPTDLVQRFLAEANDASTVLVAKSAAGIHPVVGLWPVGLAADLKASLERGERKVTSWVKDQGAVEVLFPPADIKGRSIDPFFNINTPEDLVTAETFFNRGSP